MAIKENDKACRKCPEVLTCESTTCEKRFGKQAAKAESPVASLKQPPYYSKSVPSVASGDTVDQPVASGKLAEELEASRQWKPVPDMAGWWNRAEFLDGKLFDVGTVYIHDRETRNPNKDVRWQRIIPEPPKVEGK